LSMRCDPMVDYFNDRLSAARHLADDHRFEEAIVLFNCLCEEYPNRAAPIIDSANAYSRVFDYAAVARRFAQVEARSPVPADVWTAMAEIGERLRRPQWATRYFINSISTAIPSARAFGLFALYLERANQLDQAEESCDRGLNLEPGNKFCRFAKAKVLRRRKSYDQAGQVLSDLIAIADPADRILIAALFELAHVRDSQDDCSGAIDALLRAKRLSAQSPEHLAFQRRSVLSLHNHHRFLTTLNAAYFKAAQLWQPPGEHRMALLGGHPRSGTTLLEQVLDAHSNIISAEETLVFGSKVNDPFLRELTGVDASAAALNVSEQRIESLRNAYFSTMEIVLNESVGGRVLIDKNPSYTDCIPVIARVFPEASYIIAIRDPRDVVLSCFFQDLPVNDVSVHFQTLKDTAMRYANTMAMWLVCRENMDSGKWIEVQYEALVTSLPEVTRRVMAFLNLDVQPLQSTPQLHALSRRVVSPTYADVSQPVHQQAVGKWKKYERWLGEAMPILETFIAAFDY
jgi:tetratricopeptide (TPR) repeat protein